MRCLPHTNMHCVLLLDCARAMETREIDHNRYSPKLQDSPGRLVACHVDELHPHPSYVRHHLAVPAFQLSALISRADLAFREPLVITQNRTIVDGYARWDFARQQGRLTLPCIEYQLNEEEALQWLLEKHRGSKGLNAFSRTLLALELEPWIREKARSNRREGGQNKGSSKLTEDMRVDVRSEVALAAGVSVGNVCKVKQLTMTAQPELLQALRNGEISIHRAWVWSKESPEEQRAALWLRQGKTVVQRTIRTLISRHRPKNSPIVLDLGDIIRRLSELRLGPISVAEIKVPGRTVFMTEELLRALGPQEELPLTCSTNSH